MRFVLVNEDPTNITTVEAKAPFDGEYAELHIDGVLAVRVCRDGSTYVKTHRGSALSLACTSDGGKARVVTLNRPNDPRGY